MKWPVFIIFGIMSFLPTNAQTTMDKLIGKDWELQFSSGNHPSEGIHFTETESLYFTEYDPWKRLTVVFKIIVLNDTVLQIVDINNPRYPKTLKIRQEE